jgi:L-asparagine oxygenase
MSQEARRVLAASEEERQAILSLAERVCQYNPVEDAEKHISTAQTLAAELPRRFRQEALHFRRYGSANGGLLLQGLPTGPIPPTPEHADEAVGTTLLAAGVLALFAALLGDQFGFRPELSGHIVQDILPVRGFEDTQQSISSTMDLFPHVETAFTDNRADYVGLFCVRQDHDGVAGTSLSPIEGILKMLDPPTVNVLSQPRFKTTVDGSFLRGSGRSDAIFIGPIEIMSGPENRPRLRCDFAETAGLDAVAGKALERLRMAVIDAAITIRLLAGDLLFVDNNHSFHGRTAFQARWDGRDRWLLRTFVTCDLSRSAADRPGDGRIVDTDYSHGPHVLVA